MKIAILSDIHDNVWNLQRALKASELQATEAMLFCGDLCAPFIIKLLGQGYTKPIHLVFGNNDGDVHSIIAVAKNFPNIHLHGETFRGELGGLKVAMNHYPEKARAIAENGNYDLICYGHNHTQAEEMVNGNLLLNPGAIMGFHGGSLKDIPTTFVVIDTDTGKTKSYTL